MGRRAGQRRLTRRMIVLVTALAVVLLAGGLYWFQPWRLWTNTVVDDDLPVLAAVVTSPSPITETTPMTAGGGITMSARSLPPGEPTVVATSPPMPSPVVVRPGTVSTTHGSVTPPRSSPARPTAPPAGTSSPRTSTRPATAVLLAAGRFISHEHNTSGSAELVRLADGHRVLALKDLHTSDGPALHVWLTDAPVLTGSDGWHLFDDGRHLDLGDLKGNIGNQVYPIPDGTVVDDYSSVTIWCERFSVSFGAAALDRA